MHRLQINFKCISCLVVLATSLVASTSVLAGDIESIPLDLMLVIDNPIQSVGPSDNVLLNITLTNELSSSGVFDSLSIGSKFISNGTLVDLTPGAGNPYDVSSGTPTSFTLNPGESIGFTFLTLNPDPAPVAAGVYTSSGLGFNYGDDGFGSSFSVSSTNGIEITVIPEPATAMLFLVGTSLLATRHRRSAR